MGVAAISYDSPAVLTAFAKQRGISFPLLSDQGSATIRAFGILNYAVEWGLGERKDDPAVAAEVNKFVAVITPTPMMRGMAFPGTFILDRRGRVTSRFFEDFYVERSTVSNIMVRAGKSAAPVPATKIASAQLDLTTFLTDPEVAVGNRVSIVVDVEPKPGMHVYAPGAVGYRVIGLTIAPQPFVRVLPPTYPASEIYHFKPLNERVPVFRKPFRIVQDVLIEGTSQAQAAWRQRTNVTLAGTLEYQACDDKVCFNPVSVPVSWTVALKRLVTERPLAPPAATPR